MKLGKVLKGYAYAHGVKQAALAREIGMTEQTCSRFLNGKPIDGGELEKVMRWIFAGDETEPQLRRLPAGEGMS